MPFGAVLAEPIARTFFLPPRGGWPVGDFDTSALRYKAYERYSADWTDPRAIYGTGEGGWKCVNGHPYCNRCASPVELSEASLEQMMIDIKKTVDPRKLRLDPTKTWYLSPEVSDGLKRFERQSPILISPGRRWWK